MRCLTLNDKKALRGMLADACEWQFHMNTSYIEAADISKRYERVLAKMVSRGPLPAAPAPRPEEP